MAKMVRLTLSSFDVVLALAERSKRDLIAAGLSESKIRIYTQWVDQSKFRPLNKELCKEETGLRGRFVVLFVGRFIEKKGARVLLQVSSKVDPNVNFVLIGDGPLASELRREASMRRNVVFVGKTDDESLVKHYNAADVFIIPSQYEEGFARVTLEALSCGTPVIAANKGCLPEMIDSSVGLLLDPSVENMAEAIMYLYRNPDELEKLEDNCRKYAEERFSERNAEIIQDAYETGRV